MVLINLSHSNINGNWNDLGHNAGRYRMITNRDVEPIGRVREKGAPPSVVWLGAGGRCVLIGCRLDDYLLTNDPAIDQIVDVGTTFHRYRERPGQLMFIRVAEVPGSVVAPPLYDGRHLPERSGDAYLPHLVPYAVI